MEYDLAIPGVDQMSELELAKYLVEVKAPERGLATRKEDIQALKGVVGGKMLAKMKKEAVDCPVKGKTVSFVECFACKNFMRRVKGKVDCKGEPLG